MNYSANQYPGQPQGYGPQQYTQPAAQPTYPPQQPPQYPPAQQGYAPAPAYGQAPVQQYGPAYGQPPQQAPATPLAQGTLDDYYGQPSVGGGAALKFTDANNQPMIGKGYIFRVTRPLTNGDIQQQTDKNGVGLTWRDGRPKFVLLIPGELTTPDPLFPEGQIKWYCKGAGRDELTRAMASAGAPEGPPEMNSFISVTLVGVRPAGPGMNPAHQFEVEYFRPQGAAPVQPAQAPQDAPVNHQLPTVDPNQQGYGPPPVQYQPQADTQPYVQQYQQSATPDPQMAAGQQPPAQQYTPVVQEQLPMQAPAPVNSPAPAPQQVQPPNPQVQSGLGEKQALLEKLRTQQSQG